MATIKFKKGDDYLVRLELLSVKLRTQVIGAGIYEGASLLIGSVREELRALPTDESMGSPGYPTAGPRKVQKEGLDESLGITPMDTDKRGLTNVSVGFNGYNTLVTRTWPKGQPNQMVARAVESGTSFMRPNPFIKRGVAKCRKQALEEMRKTCEAEIEKIMK